MPRCASERTGGQDWTRHGAPGHDTPGIPRHSCSCASQLSADAVAGSGSMASAVSLSKCVGSSLLQHWTAHTEARRCCSLLTAVPSLKFVLHASSLTLLTMLAQVPSCNPRCSMHHITIANSMQSALSARAPKRTWHVVWIQTWRLQGAKVAGGSPTPFAWHSCKHGGWSVHGMTCAPWMQQKER